MLWCTGFSVLFICFYFNRQIFYFVKHFYDKSFLHKTMIHFYKSFLHKDNDTLLVFNVVFLPGVYFYKDNILGNCTILPLKKSSFGAKLNHPLTNHTGDFMLDMQNPLELFYLDKGYTFVGTVIFVQFFFIMMSLQFVKILSSQQHMNYLLFHYELLRKISEDHSPT